MFASFLIPGPQATRCLPTFVAEKYTPGETRRGTRPGISRLPLRPQTGKPGDTPDKTRGTRPPRASCQSVAKPLPWQSTVNGNVLYHEPRQVSSAFCPFFLLGIRFLDEWGCSPHFRPLLGGVDSASGTVLGRTVSHLLLRLHLRGRSLGGRFVEGSGLQAVQPIAREHRNAGPPGTDEGSIA